MASEPDTEPRNQHTPTINGANIPGKASLQNIQISVQDKHALIMQRIADILSNRSPSNQFNGSSTGDVKLTMSSKDGISVSMSMHRQILVAHSRFFEVKLSSDRWAKPQRSAVVGPYVVEIADCDGEEVYIETLRLMYCKNLRRKLMKEAVSRVLVIFKSVEKIGDRADRMQIGTEELFLYYITDVEDILGKIQLLFPRAVIVDSIHIVYLKGVAGSARGIQQVGVVTQYQNQDLIEDIWP